MLSSKSQQQHQLFCVAQTLGNIRLDDDEESKEGEERKKRGRSLAHSRALP
jgi:hypothetical protein